MKKPIRKKNPKRPKVKAKPKKRKLQNWEVKKKPGPVPIKIDLKLVREFSRYILPDYELAGALGISLATLKNKKAENPAIQEAIEEGKALGRRSLRSKQMEVAMKGNVPMLVWLGKQYLDQKDKAQVGSDPDSPFPMFFTPDLTKPENAGD